MKFADQIIKFRDLSKSVATTFQVYYDKLEYTGFSGVEPYLANEINESLKIIINNTKLSKYASQFSKESKSELNFNDVFDAYAEILDHYKRLSRILHILEANQIDLSRQGSFTSTGTTLTLTYIKDLADMFENISHIFQTYKVEVSSIELIYNILNEIGNEKLVNIPIKQLKNINDIYSEYVAQEKGDLVIELYIHLLHRIILVNTGSYEGKEIIKYVNNSIELLKSQVLNTDEIKNISKQNKANNTVQKLIQMHNLVPTSMSVPLSELLSTLGVKVAKEKKTSLEKYLKDVSQAMNDKRKIGFIVITKIILYPLEYNIWTLIDQKYLESKQLIQPPEVGLNEKVLEKCKTIIRLEHNGKDNKIKDSVQIFNDMFSKDEPGLNYYFVIETIDGEHYRFLSPFSMSSLQAMAIPASWLENIDNKDFSPSRRNESYNIIINQEIMKHIEKPYVTIELINREEVQKEETYWRTLRDRIKRQIVSDFVDLFTDMMDEKGQPTAKKIMGIMFDDILYENALNHITENIELESIKDLSNKIPANVINQFQAELTLSYFYDLSYIERSLKRDVENIYKREYEKKVENIIGDKIQESKLIVIKNKLSEIFDLIISEVLEKFINRKSGIYLSIQKKFDILSKTLLKL